MIYRQTLQTTADLAHWYRLKYEEMSGGWVTPEHELQQHMQDARIESSMIVLDVGCGDGSFVRFLRSKGINADGIDPAIATDSNQEQLFSIDICDLNGDDKPYPYYHVITSLGSLEHVIDIDAALDNIHSLLKPTGRFYFFVPNELWVHEDQPNERTATDLEWKTLFMNHGLRTDFEKRWNDSTAFGGVKL